MFVANVGRIAKPSKYFPDYLPLSPHFFGIHATNREAKTWKKVGLAGLLPLEKMGMLQME